MTADEWVPVHIAAARTKLSRYTLAEWARRGLVRARMIYRSHRVGRPLQWELFWPDVERREARKRAPHVRPLVRRPVTDETFSRFCAVCDARGFGSLDSVLEAVR